MFDERKKLQNPPSNLKPVFDRFTVQSHFNHLQLIQKSDNNCNLRYKTYEVAEKPGHARESQSSRGNSQITLEVEAIPGTAGARYQRTCVYSGRNSISQT